MAVHDGSNILIKLATTLVNGTTSQTLNTNVDLIDITTKDSAGNKEYLGGEFGGTIGVEGKVDHADTYGYSQLLAAQQAKTAVAFIYSSQAEAEATWTGSAIIGNLSRTDPENAPPTWSLTLTITGALTEGTIAST